MLTTGLVMLTQNSIPVLGQIAAFFGIIMDMIYNFFGSFGIYSLGLTIIFFTIFTRLLLLPLAIKQQKSTKEMQLIQPELKKIQGKYKNKKDQESQRKMQAEMTALYQKHGVNPFGGCLPLLIQFPIIISLYQVLRNVPAYIGSIKGYYVNIFDLMAGKDGAAGVADYSDKLSQLMQMDEFKATLKVSNFDAANPDKVVDLLYKFQSNTWDAFYDIFSGISTEVGNIVGELNGIYDWFGINLADRPDLATIGILIPVLNVAVQFIVMRQTMSKQKTGEKQPGSGMMYAMPLLSGFFAIQLPAGLGLYWLMGSLFQLGQTHFINNYIHKNSEIGKKALPVNKNTNTAKKAVNKNTSNSNKNKGNTTNKK